jgi:hypothetical protein
MADKKLEIIIDAKDNASATMTGLGNSVNKTFGTIGKMAKVAGVALLAVGGATVAFGIASMKAYADAEMATIKLSKNLLTVKGNTLEHVEALGRQATALQRVGVIEGDVITAGQSQLATFGLQAKTIETLTPKIADMAVQLDGYNVSQETMVTINNLAGKVMTGQVGALSKYGVTLSDTQKKIMQTGTEEKKASEMVKILSQNYGELNKALGNTPAGKVIQLKNAFGDAQEAVGGMLTNALVPMFNKISDIANKLSEMNIPEVTMSGWTRMREGIQGFFSDTNVVWQFLKVTFEPMLMSIKNTAMDAFTTMKNALMPIMPELKIMAVFFGVVLMGAIVAIGWIFTTTFKIIANVITGFVQIFSGVVGIIKGLVTVLTMGITGDWKTAVDGIKIMWQGLQSVLGGIFRVIFSPFASAWDNVYGKIQQGISWLTESFGKIVDLWNRWNDKKNESKNNENHATGGTVMRGKSYIVGEHGPEVFTPTNSGNIEKNGGGRSTNNNSMIFNFNFSGAVIGDKASLIAEIQQAINRRQELTSLGIR